VAHHDRQKIWHPVNLEQANEAIILLKEAKIRAAAVLKVR